jgi:hypothetical protein
VGSRNSSKASWGEGRTSKRYLLLVAGTDLSEERLKELQATLDSRYGKVKLIQVRGNPRAVIVKTTNQVAPLMRDPSQPLMLAGEKVETVLTSGAVVNLKKRALEAKADGQVPKR